MISEDARLRKDIRKSILNDSRLLESISKAQLEQEMQNRVTAVIKKHGVENIVKEEAATESLLDVKHYLDEVMHELLTKQDQERR